MTTQLIPLFNGKICNETTLLCDARDLHAFLSVGKIFAAWIKDRIADYGFIENQDYVLLTNTGKQNSGRGGHNRKDYHLTLDTAKELAMVERNDKRQTDSPLLHRMRETVKTAGLQPHLSGELRSNHLFRKRPARGLPPSYAR